MTAPSAFGRLRIGVTIGLHSADESLWVNGIKQNALYLAKLFRGSPRGHAVTLVNTTEAPITSALPITTSRFTPAQPRAAHCNARCLDALADRYACALCFGRSCSSRTTGPFFPSKPFAPCSRSSAVAASRPASFWGLTITRALPPRTCVA